MSTSLTEKLVDDPLMCIYTHAFTAQPHDRTFSHLLLIDKKSQKIALRCLEMYWFRLWENATLFEHELSPFWRDTFQRLKTNLEGNLLKSLESPLRLFKGLCAELSNYGAEIPIAFPLPYEIDLEGRTFFTNTLVTIQHINDTALVKMWPGITEHLAGDDLGDDNALILNANNANQIREWMELHPTPLAKIRSLFFPNLQLKTIPHEIKNFSNLIALDLSDNEITTIPYPLFSLKFLKNLELPGNHISRIPSSLATLDLLTLNLCDNLLIEIPNELIESELFNRDTVHFKFNLDTNPLLFIYDNPSSSDSDENLVVFLKRKKTEFINYDCKSSLSKLCKLLIIDNKRDPQVIEEAFSMLKEEDKQLILGQFCGISKNSVCDNLLDVFKGGWSSVCYYDSFFCLFVHAVKAAIEAKFEKLELENPQELFEEVCRIEEEKSDLRKGGEERRRFGKKRFVTSNFLRLVDAMANVEDRLLR